MADRCCENCGWSEIVGSPIMCNYNGHRTFRDEYCQAWKPKEQQQKKGHWIEQEGFDGDSYYDCSVCGESWVLIDGTPKDNGMIYCPHCGARMDGDG